MEMDGVDIHFLGLSEGNEMNLYKLSVNPWLDMKEDYRLTKYKIKIDFQTFNYNEIKRAFLIDMSNSYELKLSVIVQLNDCVLALLENNEILTLHENRDGYEMSPILMVIGLSNRCYYVRRSEREGDEIICIFYDNTNDEIAQRVRYAQKDRIFAISVNHKRQPTTQ